MSFLKKFNKQRSVDLDEEVRKKDEKEKAKEQKRAKRHSVHVTSKRDIDQSVIEEGHDSRDDLEVEKAMRKKKESDRKERERKKFKDMKGVIVSSPNEYPVFIVHYLGRMPADAEYGREAVEEPVHQLCKLREKQKLQKTLLAFNVEGMMVKEVTGPFLKPKKEGLQFFIPLHHITYGVGSLTHPQVFAIITKMTDDPSPVNQVLVLHAFLCDKAEEAQALTYWQLQAYIEAFEDLKRKRLLKQRRKQAMSGSLPEGVEAETPASPPARGAAATASAIGAEGPGPSGAPSRPTSSSGPSKDASVKPKRTNSTASTTSSSSSSSSSKKTTPNTSRKKSSKESKKTAAAAAAAAAAQSSEKSPDPVARQTGGIQTNGSIIQMPQKEEPHKLKSDAWPPTRRGPPALLRGPPPDIGTIGADLPPLERSRRGQGSADSRDSAYVEGDEEFPITFLPTGGAGASSPPASESVAPAPPSGAANEPVIPGIAPRRSSESEGPVRVKAFENRIQELNQLVEMDAEKLKKLMIQEYPTLSRKIYFKVSVDEHGTVSRVSTNEADRGKAKGGAAEGGAAAATPGTPHTGEDSVV